MQKFYQSQKESLTSTDCFWLYVLAENIEIPLTFYPSLSKEYFWVESVLEGNDALQSPK